MKMPFRLDYKYERRRERLRRQERRKEAIRLCPTPGCYGFGNKRNNRFWHYSQHSCPLKDGNLINVRIGYKSKDSKVVNVPIDSFETPVFDDKDKIWHYFIIIGGEGSAELKVYKNSHNIDQQVIKGEIISEQVLKQESAQELSTK